MRSAEKSPSRTKPTTTIPVIEERVDVRKRVVDRGRGVRVTKHVKEHDLVIDQPLMREEVSVERVAVDQVISGPPPSQRYEGETLVIPVLEEVLVLEKRVHLKEEIRITRRRRSEREAQRVTLKAEDVSVEQFDEESPKGGRHG